MPWKPSDALRHTKKATTAKKKRQFADVADSVLAKTGDEGRAIREASAAVAGTARRHIETESNTYNWRSRKNLRRGKQIS